MDIERLFNIRFGADAADDVLPALFLDEPMPAGPTAGSTVDLETMLAEFYVVMGWTEEGVPTEARLRRLGLGEFVPHQPEV